MVDCKLFVMCYAYDDNILSPNAPFLTYFGVYLLKIAE